MWVGVVGLVETSHIACTHRGLGCDHAELLEYLHLRGLGSGRTSITPSQRGGDCYICGSERNDCYTLVCVIGPIFSGVETLMKRPVCIGLLVR